MKVWTARSALPRRFRLQTKMNPGQVVAIEGRDVLRNVRDHPSTVLLPIVIVTSSDERSDVLRAYELGCNPYVRKSVDFDSSGVHRRLIGFSLNLRLTLLRRGSPSTRLAREPSVICGVVIPPSSVSAAAALRCERLSLRPVWRANLEGRSRGLALQFLGEQASMRAQKSDVKFPGVNVIRQELNLAPDVRTIHGLMLALTTIAE